MRKRIVLFIIGFALAAGALWTYQFFTGANFLAIRKPLAGGTRPNAEHPPTYEQRAPNGDLMYLLSAAKAAPRKDENDKPLPGQYDLTQPMATYYTTDGNILYIRSDRGTISIDDRTGPGNAKQSVNDRFRGAHLAGHVILTYGPRDSFTDNSLDIKTGQFQVQFEKDLDLNFAEGVVTSPGLVHLRADQDRLRFDGENLTIAFNRSEKKQEIELLRIEPTSGHDNYMLIKDVGRQGFSLDDTTVTTKPVVTKPPAAPESPPATLAAAPTTTGPATQATAKAPPVVYRVSLGNEVVATLGGRKLTSNQLFVFFQSPNNQNGKKNAANAPAPDATLPAPSSAPATAPASAPAPKAAPDDLAVTWKGPLEMRPATPDDVQLTDRHDIALQAVGTPEQPVKVQDESSTATAGILQYHRATQSVALSPGTIGPVVIAYTDPADSTHSVVTLTCPGVNFSRAENHVQFAGPGHIEVPQSALRRTETDVTGKPLVVTWEKTLDVELAALPGKKDAKRMAIRHALFAGKASIDNVDFHLDSDALDLLVAATTGETTRYALEHLLATGAVHVKGQSRPNAGVDDSDFPNGLNADRLEVLTALAAGSAGRTPSRLLADGNVTAWAYQFDQNAKEQHPSKQTLYTPKLDVKLVPKLKANAATSARFNDVDAKSLLATDGVIVELEGFSPQTIYAKAKTLSADMTNGRDNALVKLDGERLADGTIQTAEVSQGERGENKITGLQILLDQKKKSIDIPGKGTFAFVQPPQKTGQAPMPAEVSWSISMHYDGKSMLASFLGDIDAHLVGFTDQIGKLTCNQRLDIQLATEATPATTTSPAGKSKPRLSNIAARGNVNVQSTRLDPAGKVLTSIYLTKTEALDYNEASKTLNIPGPGQMLIQDYRAEKGEATNDNSHGDTVFVWGDSLTENGPSGTIVFSKNVLMKHRPLKPFRMPGSPAAPAAPTAPAAPPAVIEPLVLSTDTLTAKLDQSKATGGGDTSASPLAMSSGGNQKVESVLAAGHSVLTLGENKLNADNLDFNELTHIATATGSEDVPAEIFQPGEAILRATHITWDVTKGKNAIQATGIRGALQQN